MQSILITGSKGQLGSEIQFLSHQFNQFNFIFTDINELDITDKNALNLFFSQNKPQWIINCAAYTAVDKAEDDRDMADKINFEAVENLAKMASEYHAKLVHISTDYVFDGMHYRPYTEFDSENPKSAYGCTKLEGEEAVQQFATEYLIIRTSWLYSVFGNNFVKTMLRLGKERSKLNVVFDQIGTPTNARDLANAILHIIQKATENESFFKKGLYHYSNEGLCSWYDFAKEIMDYAKLSCQVEPILSADYPAKAPRPYFSVLDKSKVKKTFDIKIPHWKDSLLLCLNELV